MMLFILSVDSTNISRHTNPRLQLVQQRKPPKTNQNLYQVRKNTHSITHQYSHWLSSSLSSFTRFCPILLQGKQSQAMARAHLTLWEIYM